MSTNRRTFVKTIGASALGVTAMAGRAVADSDFEIVETRTGGSGYSYNDPERQFVTVLRDFSISASDAESRVNSIEALLDYLEDNGSSDIEAYTVQVFDWDGLTPYDDGSFDYHEAASIIASDFPDVYGNGVYAFLTDRLSSFSSQGRFHPDDSTSRNPGYEGNPYTGEKHDDEDGGFALCTTNIGRSSDPETAAHEVGHALLSYNVRSDLYPDTMNYGDDDSNSDHGLAAVREENFGTSLRARTIMSTSNPENAYEQVTEGGGCDYQGDLMDDESDVPPRTEEMSTCGIMVMNEGFDQADD